MGFIWCCSMLIMNIYYLVEEKEFYNNVTKKHIKTSKTFHNYIMFMGEPWVSKANKEVNAARYTEKQLAIAKRYYLKKGINVKEELIESPKKKKNE